MSEDEREDADDANESESGRNADEETVADVDHAHPTTGETFDQTGVHGRGQGHPEATANAAEAATDESEEEEDATAEAAGDDTAEGTEDGSES